MSEPRGSRRETVAGSVPKVSDFMRDACVACPRACIQTNVGTSNVVVTRMRRNIDLASATSIPLREVEQRSS